MAKRRPVASLTLSFTQGLARFQSKVATATRASANKASRAPASQSTPRRARRRPTARGWGGVVDRGVGGEFAWRIMKTCGGPMLLRCAPRWLMRTWFEALVLHTQNLKKKWLQRLSIKRW